MTALEPKQTKGPARFLETLSKGPVTGDEFAELRGASKPSPGCLIPAFLAFAVLFFTYGILSSFGNLPADIFVLLFYLALIWELFDVFPSLRKIIPLRRQILQMRSQKLSASPVDTPSARRIDTSDELEFISRLMELGSRELSMVRFAESNNQSLSVKEALLYSHIISAIWAGSIPLLMLILFKPQLISLNIDAAVVCWLGSPAAAVWLWLVHEQEYRLRLKRLHLIQKDRDRFAGDVSKMLLHDMEEYTNMELPLDFGLYLRAFMTTDKLHLNGLDFETLLAYTIAPTLPLIALGRPGEHVGAGRIQTTDEHWQEEILRLMKRARLILIIPSHREGTLWEILNLRELGYFEKTIFMMPPELEFQGGKYSDDWQITVAAAAEKAGVQLPSHVPAGRLFRLTKEGKVENSASLLSEEFFKEELLDPTYIPNYGAEVAGWEINDMVSDAHHAHDLDGGSHGGSEHDHDAGTYIY